jgi:hypothetical protein
MMSPAHRGMGTGLSSSKDGVDSSVGDVCSGDLTLRPLPTRLIYCRPHHNYAHLYNHGHMLTIYVLNAHMFIWNTTDNCLWHTLTGIYYISVHILL